MPAQNKYADLSVRPIQFRIEIESSKQYDRECGHTSYIIVFRTSSKASKLVPGPFNTLQLQPNISSLEYPEEAKI